MTDDIRYHIVFEGQLVAGAAREAVEANLGKLFRMPPEKVAALFSGKRVILKRDADQATAMKFRAALKQAGAQCQLVPVGEESPVTEPAPTAASAPAAPEASASASTSAMTMPAERAGDREMVGTIRTGGAGFSGPFDVAPVGADMAEGQSGVAAEVPDISHLSMAPAGADLEELKPKQAPVNPDISHLSLSD
ncbi:hypothetical protein [Isoalcanivorax indicus]|uniref:hypothetical protein n=1 Tax=Isoalcanivorax indicus TaxID=2202653 RepID=UPI000DB96CD9|nr:hypothetical protein [Isoalcanivorax indicus]